MQLTIFKNIGLPKDKDDKKRLSFFSSKPHIGEVVSCTGIKELLKQITTYGWSPSLFEDYRNQSGFIETNFLTLDIDDGLTISNALSRVQKKDLLCICLPTTSHSKEKNKFRLVFPTCTRVSGTKDFVHNMERLRDMFPEADEQCVTDSARFYFPCIMSDDGFIHEGELFMPTEAKISQSESFLVKDRVSVKEDIQDVIRRIYGTDKSDIPECIDYFVRNAHTGLHGEWNTSLNTFVFTLALQAVEYDTIYDVVDRLAPEELDSKDEYVIDRAFRQGEESSEN